MKRFIPSLVLLFAGCGAGEAPGPAFIEDFLGRAESLACEPVDELTSRESVVEEVSTIDDSTFMVMYAHDREIVVYDDSFRERWSVRFDVDGPTGVRLATSATVVGDSIVYIADRPLQRLKRLDRRGLDRGMVQLDFPPERVQARGAGLLVTPFVMGARPRWLIHDVIGETAAARHVRTARHSDPVLGTLANMTVIATYPDGRAVVGHRFVVPFAHVIPADKSERTVAMPIPLPDGLRSSMARLPRDPISEENADEVPASVLAAAPDHHGGDLLYIARTGRRIDDRFEKAIVRVDPELRFRSAYLPGVNAIHIAYLANRSISLIADEEDRWYQCPTP